jgi:hypothetical protein
MVVLMLCCCLVELPLAILMVVFALLFKFLWVYMGGHKEKNNGPK